MVIFRKETKKKNANRSTPCILVQNLGVSGKRTDSASFFWSLHPLLGRGCLGCFGAGGGLRSFFLLGRGARGLGSGSQRPFLQRQAGKL